MTQTLDRIVTKIEIGDGDCWVWNAAKDERGYARFGVEGKNCRAHRVVYELLVGPVPAGRVLDHLCRNRSCVNPDHLEPVTQAENVRRGGLADMRRATRGTKTHCPQGHPLSDDNLYTNPKSGYSRCRACFTLYNQRRRSK